MTTPSAERVGRYQLLEPIGIGPCGSVSRAKVFGVAGFERQFAVKRFHPELTATAQMAQALSAAARAYGGLEHPRIARMSEFGVAQGTTFTAVELVVGLDALRLISEAKLAGTSLAAGGALALVSQAARAIGYAHGRGLTHLGLSPTNVLVNAEGDVKITDFGILSATLPPRPIDVQRLAQRIPYLAPEQLANEATSAATDVFALGVLAYELVTGQRTFKGDTPQQIAQSVMNGPPGEPPLPRPIVRVLQRCLARSPFERFPDARALADALDAALRVAPVPGTRKDIGAIVKHTLERLAEMNASELSGMVALHVGPSPLASAASLGTAPAVATLGQRESEPGGEFATTEFVRPDTPVAGPTPLVGPRGSDVHDDRGELEKLLGHPAATTLRDLPQTPFATVPGLAPPPIPVPQGVAPAASTPPPTKPTQPNTLIGIQHARPATPLPSIKGRATPPAIPAQSPPPLPAVSRAPTPPPMPPAAASTSGPLRMTEAAPTAAPVPSLSRPTPPPPPSSATPPPTPPPRPSSRIEAVSDDALWAPVKRADTNSEPWDAAARAETDADTVGPVASDEFAARDQKTNEMPPLLAEQLSERAAKPTSELAPLDAEPGRGMADVDAWRNPASDPKRPEPSRITPPPHVFEGHAAPPVPSTAASDASAIPTPLGPPELPPGQPFAALPPSAVASFIASDRTGRAEAVPVLPRRRSSLPWILGGVVGIAAIAAAAFVLLDRSDKGDAPTGTPIAATPGDAGAAKPALDAAQVAVAPSDAGTAAVAADARVVAVADDAGAGPADARVAIAPSDAATTAPTGDGDQLTITSTPKRAQVFIDGADAGVTPLTLPGSADKHTIALLLPGHELYVAQVDGRGTFAIPLKEVTPSAGPAGIKVTRCKAKERYYVFVDGKPTGQTCPTERIEVDLGPHTVEVYDVVTETRRKWEVDVKETRLSVRVRIDP